MCSLRTSMERTHTWSPKIPSARAMRPPWSWSASSSPSDPSSRCARAASRCGAHSIHALIGENGAGKSTLVKIMAGLYRRDAGEFRFHGESVDFTSTAQSKSSGIAVIYQEPTLFPDLSITENIFMGRQPTGRLGRIDRAAMHDEVTEIFARLGVTLDPDRITEGLSIADQQIIEIAKAISLDASVLIMDEPTAALSGIEVDRLFQVARSLRDEGRAIMFISHRFDEVFALCDTVTVMRDGAYIATHAIADTTEDDLVRQMVGRDVADLFPKKHATVGDELLRVEGLTNPGVFHDISFSVHSGEIVALAGLVGRRTQRSGPGRVWRRPLRLRFGLDARQADPRRPADGRHERGPRPRSRRPSQAGSRHRRDRGRQHRHGDVAEDRPVRPHHDRHRAPGGPPVGREARGQEPRARHDRRHALGRQPAEGRAARNGSPPTRRSSSSTSPPEASTSAPRPPCTRCSRIWPPRGSASS